jgi:hypothetical protein
MTETIEKSLLELDFLTRVVPRGYNWIKQKFDGGGRLDGTGLVLRENRFGGLCTQGRHFSKEDGDLSRAVAALIDLPRKLPSLHRGRQPLQPISAGCSSTRKSSLPWARQGRNHGRQTCP